ncbi:hypothetical protein BIW11_03252 [Tropilaelaps mercedesae]|uniref:Uncharacterized protein n=1 Tax=Tropilaelaps mercedesae TaxID=418985 RepID=A0A1V9XPU4_9ACAR|nr:hypothetical protein BIW11_03252 [Tropilaelaps mercedesae]
MRLARLPPRANPKSSPRWQGYDAVLRGGVVRGFVPRTCNRGGRTGLRRNKLQPTLMRFDPN